MRYTTSSDARKRNLSGYIWRALLLILLACMLIAACDAPGSIDPSIHDNGGNNDHNNQQPSCTGVVVINSCNVNNGNSNSEHGSSQDDPASDGNKQIRQPGSSQKLMRLRKVQIMLPGGNLHALAG